MTTLAAARPSAAPTGVRCVYSAVDHPAPPSASCWRKSAREQTASRAGATALTPAPAEPGYSLHVGRAQQLVKELTATARRLLILSLSPELVCISHHNCYLSDLGGQLTYALCAVMVPPRRRFPGSR